MTHLTEQQKEIMKAIILNAMPDKTALRSTFDPNFCTSAEIKRVFDIGKIYETTSLPWQPHELSVLTDMLTDIPLRSHFETNNIDGATVDKIIYKNNSKPAKEHSYSPFTGVVITDLDK